MSLTGNIVLNINSLLVLAILYIQVAKFSDRDSLQDKLFIFALLTTAFMLVVDCFSRFDGYPDTAFSQLNRSGNFLMFIMSPVLSCCWLLYVHFQIFHDERKTLRLLWPLVVLCGINAGLTVTTLFTGWYYSIDAGNVYHRGPLFLLPAAFVVAIILSTYAMLIKYRGNVERKHYFALAFFALPPMLFIVLQILFYGVSLALNGMVFSILIVYFYIQNSNMYIDYLTGVSNRKKLEMHLKEKINASSEKNTFSGILVDLDNFKAINDAYGHAEGDEALETAAKLLKSCFRHNDLIARFGGDEFIAILEISSENDLLAAVERIQSCIARYNQQSGKPYTLNFSMGYAIYDPEECLKADGFLNRIDSLMYDNKRANKAAMGISRQGLRQETAE